MTFKRSLSLILLLSVSWLILSGITNGIMLSLGTLSVLASFYWITKFYKVVNFNFFGQILILKFLWNVPAIFKEIVKSNINILYRIINKKLDPQLITIPNTTSTACGSYILAICLTLTPGSLILEYDEEYLLLHVLDEDSKTALTSLEFNNIVKSFENPKFGTKK